MDIGQVSQRQWETLGPAQRAALIGEMRSQRVRYNKLDTMYPDEGPWRRELYEKHLSHFRAGKENRERLAMMANRVGKPTPWDGGVLMADGTWKAMADLIIGSRVMGVSIDGTASPSVVKGIYDQGMQEVFEVTFSDGETYRCTAEHPLPGWVRSGRSRNGRPNLPKKRKLREYVEKIGNTPSVRPSLMSPRAVSFDTGDLPLPPYALGALLGDGSFRKEGVTFYTADQEILDRLVDELSPWVTGVSVEGPYDYRLLQRKYGRVGTLSHIIRFIGLDRLLSGDKYVPTVYLRASDSDRAQLLAGLIDTDGSDCEFTSKSKRLAQDVCFLVRSLGGKATMKLSRKACMNGTNGAVWGDYHRVYWRLNRLLPLTLHYKQNRQRTKRAVDYSRRIIRSARTLGRMPCVCIEVDHPDHCYVGENWVVSGNTEGLGGYETVLHATGHYPNWWEGHRFYEPIHAWVAGETLQTTRDIQQHKLIGPLDDIGSGLIPKAYIAGIKRKVSSVPDVVETVKVYHHDDQGERDGISHIGFRSYDQGTEAFMGTERHVIWMDEEVPSDIYAEALTRTMKTSTFPGGIVILTFTPLKGLTDVVLAFLPEGRVPGDTGV